jgi:hypothetical protein
MPLPLPCCKKQACGSYVQLMWLNWQQSALWSEAAAQWLLLQLALIDVAGQL